MYMCLFLLFSKLSTLRKIAYFVSLMIIEFKYKSTEIRSSQKENETKETSW